MNLKKWIYIIIGIIIFIIILLAIITFQKENNSKYEIEERQDGSEKIILEYNTIAKVKDRNTFFTVASCVDKYLIEVLSQDAQSIYNLLSTDYIKNNGITINNVLDNVGSYDKPQIFSAKTMYEVNYTDILSTYYVEGTIRDDIYGQDYTKTSKINIAVQLDKVNRTYAIIPNAELPNENNIPEITINNIENKGSNTFYSSNILDEQMGSIYIKEYSELLKNNIDEAYNKLQEDYRQKRFETKSLFEQYIKNKGQYAYEIQAESVSVEKNEDETVYTVRDYYGNRYIIRESYVLDYTIQLDDYTLENKEFEEKYMQVNNRDKGLLNADKFFEMINMQDYQSAYELLDDTFKQNQFKTEQTFENYIKSNLFLLNNVSYTSYNSQVQGLYVYTVVVTDFTEQTDKQIKMNIVMKLEEGTDFVMSFSIEEG